MSPSHDYSKRADLVEEMDKPDCDQAILFATLKRFELTNRLFTRYRTLLQRYFVADMQRDPAHTYRLTDLGAGGGDIARWLVQHCRQAKLHLTIRTIDQDPRVVQFARHANIGYPEIEVIQGDACDPTCWGTPDYVFAQHLLHHLPDASCRQLLKSLDQARLRRYVLSDLLRSRMAYHTFRMVAQPFAVGTFIIEDGSASILRGFTLQELREMLNATTSLHPVVIDLLFPARLVIVGGSGKPII